MNAHCFPPPCHPDCWCRHTIEDVPCDGVLYGRQDRRWVPVDQSGGGTTPGTGYLTDAPSDGNTYGRQSGNWVTVLNLAGGTMTGLLVLSGDPTVPLGAATRQYVDRNVAGSIAAARAAHE